MVVAGPPATPSLTMLRDRDSATEEEIDEPTARSTAFFTSSLVSPPPPWANATAGIAIRRTARTGPNIDLTGMAISLFPDRMRTANQSSVPRGAFGSQEM